MSVALDTLALLIDDDDISARLLSLDFSLADIELVRYQTVESALPILPILEPEVILTELPGHLVRENPIPALRDACTSLIVVISAWRQDAEELENIAPGAVAYFSKPFDSEDLVRRVAKLIRELRLMREQSVASRHESEEMRRGIRLRREKFLSMADLINQKSAAPTGSGTRLPYGLSKREYEVLALIVEGLWDNEIAQRLGIANNTASKHVMAIREKLGVRSRTEAAVKAFREGLVDAFSDT